MILLFLLTHSRLFFRQHFKLLKQFPMLRSHQPQRMFPTRQLFHFWARFLFSPKYFCFVLKFAVMVIEKVVTWNFIQNIAERYNQCVNVTDTGEKKSVNNTNQKTKTRDKIFFNLILFSTIKVFSADLSLNLLFFGLKAYETKTKMKSNL